MSQLPHPRTALITGAARRIGAAIARDLVGQGWRVGLHCWRSQGEAAALAEELEALGGTVAILPADLSDVRACNDLIPRCRDALGSPTCLVNNASQFLLDTVATMTGETWSAHLDVNLKAPVFLAKALADGLPQDQTGNIINVIDQRVWKLTPEFFSYTISKAGLWTATRTLAQALAPRVRVNAIGPGPVLRSVYQTDDDFAAEAHSTLMGRGPTPEEIAAAVRFILDAGAMTGQMIALDGGQHLAWAQHGGDTTPGSATGNQRTR